jgi:hypothetical protein|tara:strand:- start:1052 stop:1225 length:174 start_codon:yes stop_codon:yes gene_type:complete
MIEQRAKRIIIDILQGKQQELREILKECQSDPDCPLEVSNDLMEGLKELEYAIGELK